MAERSPQGPLSAVGVWVLVTLGVAFFFLLGVHAYVQAALHAMIGLGLGIALTLPDARLARAAFALRWGVAAAVLSLGLAASLVPVPAALGSLLAPGLGAAHPTAAWHSLAIDPSSVPAEIAYVVLVFGFGALVATWGAARHRRGDTEFAAMTFTGALALFAMAHAAENSHSVLGLVSPSFFPSPFLAPFVNPNHAASAMLLGGPIAVGVLIDPDQDAGRRFGAALVVVAALVVILWSGSGGALLACGAVAGVWTLRSRGLPNAGVAVLVAATVAVQMWASATAAIEKGSMGARATLWRDAARMGSQFWFAGTGGGSFGEAIRAFRTDRVYLAYAHAHNDPLEWIVETGFVGLAAGLVAAAVLWRGTAPGPRSQGWAYALLGVGLHSLVEFPLQMPAIALAVAAVAACRVSVFSPPVEVDARRVRGALLMLGLAQLPAALWQGRTGLVDVARDDVRAFATDPVAAGVAARTLADVWAVDPEVLLYRAWAAEAAHDQAGAVRLAGEVAAAYPNAPDALRESALVLARARDFASADAVLARAIDRDPSDYRNRVVRARVLRATGAREAAVDEWSAAFLRGAPPRLLSEAYEVMPSGLVWLEVLSGADAKYSAQLALLLADKARAEEALLACDQAARIDPVSYRDSLVRVRLLLDTGRGAEAEAWIAEVVARNPDDANALVAQSEMYTRLSRYGEATEAMLRASRLNPVLRWRVVESAHREGGAARALQVARQFELEGDVEPGVRLQIATLHMELGDYANCKAEIERFSLTTSPVGPQATELLEVCRRLSRGTGG